MRSSFLQITITCAVLYIWKTWALSKFVRLKNCLDTISGLIIVRIKLMELLIPYLDIPNGMFKKKSPWKPKIPRFYTSCRPLLPKCLNFHLIVFSPSIKSLYTAYWLSLNCIGSRALFVKNYCTKDPMLPILEIWGWDCQDCRKAT